MIRLIDILDYLLDRQKMHSIGLSRYLGVSTASLRTIRINGNMTNEQILLYCQYLELDVPEIDAVYQYHARERLLHSLPGIGAGRKLVADILYFHNKIDCVALHNQILPCILPHIMELPYTLNATKEHLKAENVT